MAPCYLSINLDFWAFPETINCLYSPLWEHEVFKWAQIVVWLKLFNRMMVCKTKKRAIVLFIKKKNILIFNFYNVYGSCHLRFARSRMMLENHLKFPYTITYLFSEIMCTLTLNPNPKEIAVNVMIWILYKIVTLLIALVYWIAWIIGILWFIVWSFSNSSLVWITYLFLCCEQPQNKSCFQALVNKIKWKWCNLNKNSCLFQ